MAEEKSKLVTSIKSVEEFGEGLGDSTLGLFTDYSRDERVSSRAYRLGSYIGALSVLATVSAVGIYVALNVPKESIF